jgi:hypothetical protein
LPVESFESKGPPVGTIVYDPDAEPREPPASTLKVSDFWYPWSSPVQNTQIIRQIYEAKPGDVQKIAASQIGLLDSYYKAVLAQASTSFTWALIAAGIGLLFFLGAIAFMLSAQTQSVALISGLGDTIIEVISGINFVLYGKTTAQLADFHQRLDQTQRFLLANSICESLEGEAKQKSLAELITTIATFGLEQAKSHSADSKQ